VVVDLAGKCKAEW